MASNNSNPSSEVSIEELGAEEVAAPKDEDAKEIVTDDSVPPRAEDKEDKPKQEEDDETIEEIANPSSAPAAPAFVLSRPGGGDASANNADDGEDDDDDDFEDETLLERVAGLAEMFPESLRSAAWSTAAGGVSGVQWLYSASRSLSFVVFSSAAVLFLPVMIETERLGIDQMQKQQQRQILLGPGAAVSGGMAGAGENAPLPPMAM